MAFITKEWKDRLVEFAGRRILTNVATGDETVVEVARAEGMVSQPGDAFSAATMNDLEQRLKDGFDQVDNDLGGCTFEAKSDGAYVTYTPAGGADPVSKKLGEPVISAASYYLSYSGSVGSGGSGSYCTIQKGRTMNRDMFVVTTQITGNVRTSTQAYDAWMEYYQDSGLFIIHLGTGTIYVSRITVYYLD